MLISLIYVVFMTFIFMAFTSLYKVFLSHHHIWGGWQKLWLSCLIVIGVDFLFCWIIIDEKPRKSISIIHSPRENSPRQSSVNSDSLKCFFFCFFIATGGKTVSFAVKRYLPAYRFILNNLLSHRLSITNFQPLLFFFLSFYSTPTTRVEQKNLFLDM